MGHRMLMHGMDPEAHANMLQHRLNLTPQQTAEVRRVFEQTQPQQQRVQNLCQELMQAHRELMDQRHTAIRQVLTPEQQAHFDQMHRQMMGPTQPAATPPADHGVVGDQPPSP
jgi:Spy/CpxP family protein refolding chaperone